MDRNILRTMASLNVGFSKYKKAIIILLPSSKWILMKRHLNKSAGPTDRTGASNLTKRDPHGRGQSLLYPYLILFIVWCSVTVRIRKKTR